MDISKLKEGMIIKNYKELCGLLGVSVKSGKSKKLQINKLERFVEYNKIGNKFEITKLKSVPDEKIERRGSKGIYQDLFQLAFIHLLQKHEGHAIISISKLRKYLGLINDNYNKGYKDRTLIATDLQVSHEVVNDFFNLNNSNNYRIITNTIKSLENKKIIDSQECLMIKYYNEFEYKKADRLERDNILQLEKLALDYFGFKDISQAKSSYKYLDYKKYRKNLLKSNMNIEFTYKAYDIVFLRNHLNKELLEIQNKIIDTIIYEESKLKINKLYYDNSINNAINRHKKASYDSFRSKDNYVDLFKLMCDNFIDLNCEEKNYKIDNLYLENQLPF